MVTALLARKASSFDVDTFDLRSRMLLPEALTALEQHLTANFGYTAIRLGAQQCQFSRSFRPRWMTLTGIVTLPALGAGVVLLSQRRTEAFSVMLASRHDGCSVAFGAGTPPEVVAAVASVIAPQDDEANFADWSSDVALTEMRSLIDETVAATPATSQTVGRRSKITVGQSTGRNDTVGGAIPTHTVADGPAVGTIADAPSFGTIADVRTHGTVLNVAPAPPVTYLTGASQTIMERSELDLAPPALAAPVADAAVVQPVPVFAPPVVAVPPIVTSESWVVFFDTGEVATVESGILVGREPHPASADEVALPIDDPAMSVSRNHFLLRRNSNGLWIEDRGSSNGTAILRAHEVIDVRVGDSWQLAAGDEIIFGDRRAKIHLR